MMTSLGCHWEGVALPHPDCYDSSTNLHGAKCRFLAKMPAQNEETLTKFGLFVDRWLKNNLTPLDPTTDVSLETWLEDTSYPRWRKEELTKIWDAQERMLDPKFDFACSSFSKFETYAEYKPTRWINARSDPFKCWAGPWIKAIEKVVYKLKWFIKNVPVAQRPGVLRDRLFRLGAHYCATDYTTFEAIFTSKLMENCEFKLYKYMTQYVPGGPEWAELYCQVLGGDNKIVSKYFTLLVEAIRMSGEMSTSLGNGFTNLMLMLFLCEENGCTDVDGVVEGDDGLFVSSGTFPSSDAFAKLGAKIKLEVHDHLESASFCGIVYHENDLINLVDVRETLASFGWCSARYSKSRIKVHKMLLRCKALSLAHQYPGCPILTALARYGLRVTRDVRNYLVSFLEKQGSHAFSLWEREQVLAALREMPSDERDIPWRSPGIDTRMLAEKLYNIPVDIQLSVEAYLDSLNEIQPLVIPQLTQVCHEHWMHYWDNYVVKVRKCDIDDPLLPRAPPRWDLAC